MTTPEMEVAAAAERLGIETTYRDAWGILRSVPSSTIAALMQAISGPGGAARVPLTVTPQRCFTPAWMLRGERLWGVAAQLYGLRSPQNWGIGDFTDLQHLITRLGVAGGDFVAVNPLHALFAADPGQISPYAPSSREFLNTLYMDVTAMRTYAVCDVAQRAIKAPSFQDRLRVLRDAELIDYPAVAACKNELFRIIFDWFDAECAAAPDDPMAAAFHDFMRDGGESLSRFATYQALSCRPGFGPDWTVWPLAYHDSNGPAIAAFMAEHAHEVRYHAFLQWEAELQLARAAAAARTAGMRIGLFLDLALGAPHRSAEGWMRQATAIPAFHIGAPPDLWNERGQDWGLAADNPLLLGKGGSNGFRRVMARNMRHAGALRIDHVLGLYRLFLVPAGGGPADGAYLHYPAEALCTALAAESEAHQCLIVGEDLGTVPAGFQQLLSDHGILSYRLLIFGTDAEGRFMPPAAYPRDALVAFSTHDLPTLQGYWSAHDIAVKSGIGLYPDEAAVQYALRLRDADRRNMTKALLAAGLPAPEGAKLLPPLLQFLARTPCRLLAVQLEDLAGELDQPNVPGTVAAHPNWRRRLSRHIEEIFTDPQVTAALAAVRTERLVDPAARA
jgi:(1->4)-alpha-D-glucan 1-alpha-D-glucosylmutase